MHFSIFSLALLAASIIPSAVAQRGREREQALATVYKTTAVTRIQTLKYTSWRKTTIIKYNTITVTKRESTTKTSVRYVTEKPSPVTVTKTVTTCPAGGDGEEEEEEAGTKEDDQYKSCPPVAVVTAAPSCKGGEACPTKSVCQQKQATPTVTYRCNCGGAPKRTVTFTPTCAEDCCSGYVPTFYTFVPLPVERCVQPNGVSEVTI
ncbi:hypothetical protein TWF481_000616 [Arthrobotrys musiformis]|uniref:Uncharacterized protein n=1 Tax=Arthrobotrys musiformis TaxID=47236 RepID=A0AAV9WN37_9PEZI